MLRAFSNIIFRGKDPTRFWIADPSALIVDVRRCTICGGTLGGDFTNLRGLGPSEDARKAARGRLEWGSLGVCCSVENGRIADFTVTTANSVSFRRFAGTILNDHVPVSISARTTPEQLAAVLGEPFGRSNNEWDDAMVFFYEFDTGEVQFAFDRKRGTLDTIEFWYEPELSRDGACKDYGIEKPFPKELRRELPE